jgi:signal transduction histidine kinase/ActR/RegA family two-component response regulator
VSARRIGLRPLVAVLVLSIVAPLGVVSALSIQRAWRRQRANVDRQNVATVRAISVAIDQEVENTSAALDVLGSLHALDVPDLAAFDSLARRMIVRRPDWSAVILSDLNGRVLAVTPDGDGDFPLAGAPPDWVRAVARTKQPAVSTLSEIAGTPGHFLTVGVPVVRDGKVTFALAARVRSASFSDVLRQQKAPPNGVVVVVDASNRVVSRSRDEATYVGAAATQAFVAVQAQMEEGAWETFDRAGVPVYSAFSRSPRTGLTVALALPREEVDGPIRRILWILGAAWLAILSVGAGIGWGLGYVIIRAMSSASDAANALAIGEPVSPKPSRIVEIDDLSTGLRQAAVTLEARNRERDEASRLKDEFLMTVSHELRTPLTAIYGWARMLSTGQIRDSQRPRAVDAIERNAAALQQLVNDLLDVSRVVSGKLRLDVQPVPLADVIAAAIDAIRPAAVAKAIQIVVVVHETDRIVMGDASRLQQVVWNLLSNAVRFTPQGGRIEVTVEAADAGVAIVVRDSGSGVPPDFLPHAFERFRQGVTGLTRAHGGLGLGLAIVRHLVELHGGTVSAANNDPQPGATFRVALPARSAAERTDADRVPTPAALAVGARAPIRLDGLGVLVTDDDLNARELLAVVLENAGADVRSASSAEDALMMFDTWSPDVFLSDIEMPGEDGYVLMRRILAQAAGRPRMVAIALTAHARPEDRLRALDAGFQWHLGKPIDPAELVSVIATLVAQAEGRIVEVGARSAE